jgi:hypothetical protein
MTSTDSVTNL